jgi:hypothetical protein
LPECDLLKIDIQGGETMVFKNGPKFLDKLAAVITEVAFIPLYEKQPLLDAQMVALRPHGLQLHKFGALKQIHLRGKLQSRLASTKAYRNQLIDGDAVFIQQVTQDCGLDVEKIKHLAIVAEAVFSSQDVVLRCLDVMVARDLVSEAAAMSYFELLA